MNQDAMRIFNVAPHFEESFQKLSQYAYEWAKRKGFDVCGDRRNDAEVIALMHSELSEALEAMRNGNPPDDKIDRFSSVEVELADVVIRILNYCGANDLNVGGAILEKMSYNDTRPYKHGKKF